VTLVIDVGPTAHGAVPGLAEVVQRIMANRMVCVKPHMELAIIAYGSSTTKNSLWDCNAPEHYQGVDVITVSTLIATWPHRWSLVPWQNSIISTRRPLQVSS
jgi:hypothetical protein